MSDILSSIAAYKRVEVARLKAEIPLSLLDEGIRSADSPRGFLAALRPGARPGRLALIAEIKKASPSRGLIRADFDPAEIARAYEMGGARCLSVLTDEPSFKGAADDLRGARAACALPCLRKDFLIDPWQVAQSRAMGADAILVILALCDDALAADLAAEAYGLGMDVLVETHDQVEVERAARLGAMLIGVNNRDLRTFVTDLAITERLAASAPANALLVTESGVFTPADAERLEASGARAMLVGESLMRQQDVEAATRALLGA